MKLSIEEQKNFSGITKERRGLVEESGHYLYGYDALGRLSEIQKDGQMQTRYGYDAFGNRIYQREGGSTTIYTYNALNQLVEKAVQPVEGERNQTLTDIVTETYRYDRRGNLTRKSRNGQVTHQYVYGALNRLEEAVDMAGKQAKYTYNGLGHRVGKTNY